jgi:hypothetical protein
VKKHPKIETVKLYFTTKTEDKLSNSGSKAGSVKYGERRADVGKKLEKIP